jgi:hypothetical protein
MQTANKNNNTSDCYHSFCSSLILLLNQQMPSSALTANRRSLLISIFNYQTLYANTVVQANIVMIRLHLRKAAQMTCLSSTLNGSDTNSLFLICETLFLQNPAYMIAAYFTEHSTVSISETILGLSKIHGKDSSSKLLVGCKRNK